jgi:hypothetical protein
MTIATSALGTGSSGASQSLTDSGRQVADSGPVAAAALRKPGVAADAAPPGLIPQHAAAR